MAMNPFEAMEAKNELNSNNEPQNSTDATQAEVSEKRKMWQIFTDDNGDIQRKSVPIDSNSPQTDSAPSTDNQNELQPQKDVQVTIPSHDADEVNLFGSLNGFANPNATAITRVANGDIDGLFPPAKPPRRVEIIPRGESHLSDTVVFQSDTTYTRFDTVNVDSEEDELLGDSLERPLRPAEEHHYVGNKVLIRSESDLDILLNAPTKRIWQFNSKYCCVDLYKWPLARSYARVVFVFLGMTAIYVAIVLIIVHIMG